MILVAIKVLLFLSVYAVFFFMLRRGARSAAYPGSLRRLDRDSNNGDDGGEGSWPKDFPKLDLPPGVYILPPGAPDPSQRKERVR